MIFFLQCSGIHSSHSHPLQFTLSRSLSLWHTNYFSLSQFPLHSSITPFRVQLYFPHFVHFVWLCVTISYFENMQGKELINMRISSNIFFLHHFFRCMLTIIDYFAMFAMIFSLTSQSVWIFTQIKIENIFLRTNDSCFLFLFHSCVDVFGASSGIIFLTFSISYGMAVFF